ncbi:D-ribose ABC transporter substrate-binding protein [Rubrobacter naiadicus]|uniref:D-ribose ABC transporter substrate-binding protein n=1 Tax=Rubrobacter naiadicus TaxID=1392641 RepID=UPI00235E6F16|nr:D-ribose ABC transporter substrate-binding protein [Rubrobacter naiadicus]
MDRSERREDEPRGRNPLNRADFLRLGGAGLAATALLGVAGCGGGSAGQGGSSGGGSGGTKTIALSLSTLNNPYFVAMRSGAQQEAKKLGVKLLIADAQNDASQQQKDIQTFITQQVDALLVNPVDSQAIVPSIQQANRAKIPVFALDRGASGGDVTSTIISNNVKGGEIAAKELIKLVGSGDVAELQGVPGTDVARDRGNGFENVIKKQHSVRLVASQPANFDRNQAFNVTQNILQAHPNIKGIYAQNDEMALGAVRALGGKAGKDVKIVGFDGEPDAIKAIKQGKMNATVAQQPIRIAQLGVQYAIKVIGGKKVPKNVRVPVKLVTRESVGSYHGWGAGAGS